MGDDGRAYLGAYLPGSPEHKQLPVKEVASQSKTEIPDSFDARTYWANCSVISDIRDQGACGDNWAFASTESFQDRACIATGKDVKYSVEDTAFCSDAGFGCSGGNSAWAWFQKVGVVTGGDQSDVGKGDTCLPYSSSPSPVCTHQCSEASYPISYADDKLHAIDAYSVKGVANIQTELMQHGPLYVSFSLYSDFPTYKSGVYQRTSTSSFLGGHAVELIGWGTETGTDYWLAKNSWNEDWGASGTFKILRGQNECGIEGDVNGGIVGAAAQATMV